MSDTPLTFGSLFAGIGGFDLGFERAGMRCLWQVEIDPFCQKVLAKHWPAVQRFEDVKNVGAGNLQPVDVICGGFPCQPHSLAGQRKGAADDRDLWPEYRRIIAELNPAYVVGENVPGIRTTILDSVLSDLENLNYSWQSFVIPACAVDAPHRRDRVFIVAHADGNNGQRRSGTLQMGREWSENETSANGDRIGTQWSVEPGICRVVNGVPNRVDRLRSLGNAVVPQVAEFIGRLVVSHWQMKAAER